MGKEEVLDALVSLQTVNTIEDLSTLSDVKRKRWKFLEDACFSVLRKVFSLITDTKKQFTSKSKDNLTIKAIDFGLQFLKPLIHSTVLMADALDDKQEAAGQRGVLVAALLYLFTKAPKETAIQLSLVTNMLECGVEMHVLVATFRFREEVEECSRVLLPSIDSDSELDLANKDNDMIEQETEWSHEDTQWITERLAKTYGFTAYQYFLSTSGQEHAFAAWSSSGIAQFLHVMLTNEQLGAKALSAVVSPYSWLYFIASYAHCMIVSKDDQQNRLDGLELLQRVIDLCPQGKLAIPQYDAKLSSFVSYREYATFFRERDWISPLIQAITSAMIAFPEASNRTNALAVLNTLLLKIAIVDRFRMLRHLIIMCPYGNVAAVLMDVVRRDTVQAWSSSEINPESPFMSSAMTLLLYETLNQSAERDLILQTDLIASGLSLFRFLYIRDKLNVTGIRMQTSERGLREVLMRLRQRLQWIIQEITLSGGFSSAERNNMHLLLLEASLTSTLELCN
ncbi:hypothetical protein CCR75_001368 [Bremia lactucae]|uniref:Uncharacterized protein n=1 Tax=Bremia lactucae TaxID=4779 RepID=A0A976FET7_BRELC|nr:hypothetical protein CCR75_001368 [Bremia lactucae]